MNIIAMLEKFTSDFNKIFCTNLSLMGFEESFQDYTDEASKKLFKEYLIYLDKCFMESDERKDKYSVKDFQCRKTLITIFGNINYLPYRRYINKETGERYIFLYDILSLKPYQRLTNSAEKELLKCSVNVNNAYAAKNALRNCEVSRAKVSKIGRTLKGSISFDKPNVKRIVKVLYIEMDELHANMQDGTNRICPCAIVHEGHIEEFTNRKALKNAYYFATAKGSYRDLWDVIYSYVDTNYDIDKISVIFVSGDGASGIKQYDEVFPKAIYVLDKYHYYYKYMNYIFKNDRTLSKIADGYLREDKLDDFITLVQCQIDKYPEQEYFMIQKRDFILNNIEGIKNQHHKLYTCPCSMEGHVSQIYARYVTSSPYGWSLDGLENKLKLLTMKANHIDITLKEFLKLKYGEDEYKEIIENIHKVQDISLKGLHLHTTNTKDIVDINIPLPIFDSTSTQDYFDRLISETNVIKIT